jgi:hypothetical protein
MEAEIGTWGRMLWLDSRDATTLFDATTGGSLPAIGAGVARWEDKSGNNYHVTQSTPANRPTRQNTGLFFDGITNTMDRLTSTDLLRNVTGATLVVAARNIASQTGNRGYLTIATAANAVRAGAGTGATIDGVRSNGRRLDADTIAAAENTTTPVSTFGNHVAISRFDYAGDRLDVYLNDVVTPAATNATFQTGSSGQPTSNTASSALYVGSTLGANHYNCLMQGVMVFHTALTQAQREYIKMYLQLKYPCIP